MGTWIEIETELRIGGVARSYPSWVRGLKYNDNDMYQKCVSRTLRGYVD